jgi:hypothetical protein
MLKARKHPTSRGSPKDRMDCRLKPGNDEVTPAAIGF